MDEDFWVEIRKWQLEAFSLRNSLGPSHYGRDILNPFYTPIIAYTIHLIVQYTYHLAIAHKQIKLIGSGLWLQFTHFCVNQACNGGTAPRLEPCRHSAVTTERNDFEVKATGCLMR